MGAHNTCLHFFGRQFLKLCLLHLHHQNLQDEKGFQQPVLKLFSNRLCRWNLKEKRFWREFEAKKEIRVMKRTKQESFFRRFFGLGFF